MSAASDLPAPDFSTFPRHGALGELLRAYVRARPGLFELREIGRSHEGREIWLMVATNRDTGADRTKPAFWVDGNIHAAELTGCTAVLYWLHQLALGYGRDQRITTLLDTRCVYLCPRLCPDGAELALADRPRQIRSSTRPWPWDEPELEGLLREDVDGDGRMLSMRIEDPDGAWKPNPAEPRLLAPREPGDLQGPFYRVLPEGTLLHWDGFTIGLNRDREGLDLNRNFPADWRPEAEQLGAGPYPTSEPEVRAVVQFVTEHPNIGAAISFHTHSGVILRPPARHGDDDMIAEDLWLYQRLSALGEKLSGYPVVGIWNEFRYHPKEVISGTQDWFYDQLGALFWTVELWAPNREAGISGYDWNAWYREHPPEDDIRLLAWSDRDCGGKAHVDWYPFEHPQLGAVELGGWDRMNYWRNPPPELREREAARFPQWLTTLALSLPRLELAFATAERIEPSAASSNANWRVRLAIRNSGYLATDVTRQARERKSVRGVVVTIELPSEASLVMGRLREDIGPLEGHAPTASLQTFMPTASVTADRALREWLVCAPEGVVVRLRADGSRAGVTEATVALIEDHRD